MCGLALICLGSAAGPLHDHACPFMTDSDMPSTPGGVPLFVVEFGPPVVESIDPGLEFIEFRVPFLQHPGIRNNRWIFRVPPCLGDGTTPSTRQPRSGTLTKP